VASVLKGFDEQADLACQAVLANENFQGDFYVVGLSQGALLARHIAEKCPVAGKVRKLLSIGGPNMGVMKVPNFLNDGWISNIVNSISSEGVYLDIVQNHLGPAGYFRDPEQYDRYLKKSVFLPHLNNEVSADDDSKEKFSSMDGAMLVMFTEDSMVYPKESEWFWQGSEETGALVMQDVKDSKFYKEDFIGLRALDEANKVSYVTIEGDHLQFSNDDISNTFVPFLLQ